MYKQSAEVSSINSDLSTCDNTQVLENIDIKLDRQKTQGSNTLSRGSLIEQKFSEDTLIIRITKSFDMTYEYLTRNNLLPRIIICEKCKLEMSRIGCKQLKLDQSVFRGVGYGTDKGCFAKRAVRTGSVLFKSSKLTIMEITRVVFEYFVQGWNATEAHRELGRFVKVDYKSIFKLYKQTRENISKLMVKQFKESKLGENNVVEIDESVFARTNNHKSGYDVHKKNAKIWVVGFFERQTKLARAFVVPNRSQETLTNLIRENVHDGAVMYTDFWKGYNGLKAHFDHRPINKSVKDPGKYSEGGTNQVESLWAVLKREINKYSGFKKENIPI